MKRLWSMLLMLYPREYREAFGPEMMAILEQRVRPAWVEIAGLLKGAAVEWVRPRRRPERAVIAGDEIASAEARVNALVDRVVYAIAHHQFETARACCREEEEARETLRVLRTKYRS